MANTKAKNKTSPTTKPEASDRAPSNSSDGSVDENFRVVGRVKDAHGLKGELWVVLFAGQADWLQSMKDEGLFRLSKKESLAGLEISDLKSFSLKGARAHKNGVILQSTEIKDRTAAEGFKGFFLTIPESFLIAEDGESYFLSEIEGFGVLEDKREIGAIVGFSHNGAQDLLQVSLVKGTRSGVKAKDIIEIPFVEEFVVEVDDEGKVIHVELPEGLIEVQLGLDKKEEPDDESSDGDKDGDTDDDAADDSENDSEDDSEDGSEDDEDESDDETEKDSESGARRLH